MSQQNLLSDIEKAAASISQVTPDARISKMKERAVLAALIIGALIVVGVSFLPSHHKAQKAATLQDPTQNNTLSQNLKLIAEMKEQGAKRPEDAVYTSAKDGFHPPKLRHTETSNQAISAEILARMNAPTSFGVTNNLSQSNKEANHNTLTANNANAQFVNQQDEIVAVSAKRIPHPDFTVPAGEMIAATMETALNSELPGMARAITTEDVYSLQGHNLLITKGATLIGQFNANVVQGQSRLLVVWNRVQMSNGVIITLNSPGTDTLGRSGLSADEINRHFMERFGTGALLSILGAFTANSGVTPQDEYNSSAQYRTAIAGSFQQAANHTLEQDMSIKPTMQINQGTRIHVFVAHDLDFYSVGAVKQEVSSHSWSKFWKK